MAERKQASGFWQRLVDAGEERLEQIAQELLSNPTVTEALGAALHRAAKTKGQVDRNLQMLLNALNLPTKSDLNKLASKLDALQGSLVNLNIKVDRLMADRDPVRRVARPRAQRHASAGSDEGED